MNTEKVLLKIDISAACSHSCTRGVICARFKIRDHSFSSRWAGSLFNHRFTSQLIIMRGEKCARFFEITVKRLVHSRIWCTRYWAQSEWIPMNLLSRLCLNQHWTTSSSFRHYSVVQKARTLVCIITTATLERCFRWTIDMTGPWWVAVDGLPCVKITHVHLLA